MTTTAVDQLAVFRHIYGSLEGYICVFSGLRPGPGQTLPKSSVRQQFYPYPVSAGFAAGWTLQEDRAGRDAYIGAHLFTDRARSKKTAAKLHALYAEFDGPPPPDRFPPTLLIESSPGHYHAWWALSEDIDAARGEALNQRIAAATGADPSGFDLTQLLRPIGTRNHKYADAPTVRLVALHDDQAYDPDDLDRLLPPLPAASAGPAASSDAAGNEDGAPPLHLDGYALEVWQGTRPTMKTDGSGDVDRSLTLYHIGAELADAGLAPRLIPNELAERDLTLGYHCYVDRPEEYERICKKLAVRKARPSANWQLDDDDDEPDGEAPTCGHGPTIIRLRRRIAHLEERVEDLDCRQRVTAAVIANKHAKPLIGPAVALAHVAASREHRGLPTDQPFRVSSTVLAGPAGASRGTVSTALKKLTTVAGVIVRSRKYTPGQVDPETGEVLDRFETHTYVTIPGGSVTMLQRVAAYDPEQPERRGGVRHACPICGNDCWTLTKTRVCDDCGHARAESPTHEDGSAPCPKSARQGAKFGPCVHQWDVGSKLCTLCGWPLDIRKEWCSANPFHRSCDHWYDGGAWRCLSCQPIGGAV